MSILELIIRSVLTIVVLLTMARLNGPKQISQMNFYDYVVGITVGSLAASVSTDKSLTLTNGLAAIVLFLAAGLAMGCLTNKSMTFRTLLTGKPIILIKGGQLQWSELKKSRLNVNELLSNLRYSGYFDINDVEEAILETTGKLSVLPKGTARPPKTRELNLTVPESAGITEVIIDGKILPDKLETTGKDEKWLRTTLEKQHVNNIEKVGLAAVDSNGTLSVFRKDE